MNEAHLAKLHRSAELEALTSVELAEMIQKKGWEIGGRQNKTNRKLALLYLEEHPVHEEVIKKLQLRRIANERTPQTQETEAPEPA